MTGKWLKWWVTNGMENAVGYVVLIGFSIRQLSSQQILSCASETERQRWLHVTEPPLSENPDEKVYEQWDCPQVMAKHTYLGLQPDELNLDPGDVVNVTRKMADGRRFFDENFFCLANKIPPHKFLFPPLIATQTYCFRGSLATFSFILWQNVNFKPHELMLATTFENDWETFEIFPFFFVFLSLSMLQVQRGRWFNAKGVIHAGNLAECSNDRGKLLKVLLVLELWKFSNFPFQLEIFPIFPRTKEKLNLNIYLKMVESKNFQFP